MYQKNGPWGFFTPIKKKQESILVFDMSIKIQFHFYTQEWRAGWLSCSGGVNWQKLRLERSQLTVKDSCRSRTARDLDPKSLKWMLHNFSSGWMDESWDTKCRHLAGEGRDGSRQQTSRDLNVPSKLKSQGSWNLMWLTLGLDYICFGYFNTSCQAWEPRTHK